MTLIHALRSELTKQFTTSIWWILALVLVVYIGVTSASLGFVFAASSTGSLAAGAPQIPPQGVAPLLYGLASSVGYVFPLLIGTLMVTSEFRHQTLTPSFLATPRRDLLLAAKVGVGIVFGVLFGVLGVISTVVPAASLLAVFDLDTQLTSGGTWALGGRTIIAFVLWVLVGIGVGTLVRNQVGAIVGVLAFTQFVEPIVRVAATFVAPLGDLTRLLPGAASDALVGSSIFSSEIMGAAMMGVQPPADVATSALEWWAGGLVLLAYAAVLIVVGYVTSWRRDVT